MSPLPENETLFQELSAALEQAAVNPAAPCDKWQSLRPTVLRIAGALRAVGVFVPAAKQAATMLDSVQTLIDSLCSTAASTTPSCCEADEDPSAPASGAQKIRRYGWIPDLPDQRDHLYAAPLHMLGALPSHVDLRPQCPPELYDQGQLGSCTANAIAAAIEFNKLKQQAANASTPSRLFIYYNERVLMGDHYVQQDSGAYLRTGIKSVAAQGAPPERYWPYIIDQFAQRPSPLAYQEALKHKAIAYQRLAQSLVQMKACLASGYPFVFGFTVYESFESPAVARSGVVSMPGYFERALGGHAVLAVGYDDAQQRFIVRNSWGPHWGQHGHFTMPYAYLLDANLSSDFWTIRKVQ